MKKKYALYIKPFLLILSILGSFIYSSAQIQNNFPIGIWFPPDIGANFIAAPADYDGDGSTDISVKTSGGYWLIDESHNGLGSWDKVFAEYGGYDAIPVPGDYDGDGKIDLAVKTNSGAWLIDYAVNGLGGWDPPFINFDYGHLEAHPIPGDYDGDGKTDLGIKTDTGLFRVDLAFNGFGSWDIDKAQYGTSEAHPVPADYDGDGKTDMAVKVDDGRWLIDYAVNGFGGWDLPYITTNWLSNAVPVPADYDGDGKADIAVKDGEKWKIDYANDGFGNFIQVYDQYGDNSAEPVPADYDGDGKADLSVKIKGNGVWLIDKSSNGSGGWDISKILGKYTDYHYLLGPTVSYYAGDLAKFQKIKSANIDFLASPDLMYINDNYARIYAYLELAKQSSLKVFLSGHNIASKQNPDPLTDYKQDFLNYFKNNLPAGLNETIMGIFLGDEPAPLDFSNVKKWTDFFKTNYPEKPLYYNLLPRYWSFNDDVDYENYLDKYVNANTTDFVSYDHYPFRNNEPFYTDYFYNMRVFKEKLPYNKPFWFVIQSNKDYAPEPYEPKLKFLTSTAIAYGAKGLLYWSYIDGFEENAVNYSSIQKVNRYIKEVIGPVVLTTDYITTLHKANTYMNQGRPFDSSELVDLNGTDVIKDVNNNNILLALYQKIDVNSTDYYIWIVNKDVSATATSTKISLEGAYQSSSVSPRVDTYTSPNNSFVTINRTFNQVTNTTTITIPELKPGEGIMLKVKRNLLNSSRCNINTENLITLN